MDQGSSNLCSASLRGKLAVVRELLLAGADVNARDDRDLDRSKSLDAWRAWSREWDGGVGPVRVNNVFPFGRTPLLHAASVGRAGLVRELIAVGADVGSRDVLGYTALTLALHTDPLNEFVTQSVDEPVGQDAACALALIAAGADVNAASFLGETPLLLAARRGFADVVDALIALGADLDGCDENKYTAFGAALSLGHAGIARTLLEAGADPGTDPDRKVTDYGDETALMLAASRSDPELVRLLLLRGADVWARTGDHSTPLHFAAGGSATEAFSRNSDDGFRPRLMCPDVQGGSAEVVRLLAAAGAEIDARDGEGMTPLMRATRRGNPDAAHALIAAGADVNAALSPRPLTEIDIALLSFSQSLRKDSADSQDPDPQKAIGVGHTPLTLACKWNAGDARHYDPFMFDRTEIIRALIAAGADVNAHALDDTTALSHALGTRAILLARKPKDWPPIPPELLAAAVPKADEVIAILRAAGAEG